MMKKKWFVALVAIGLFASACSSDATESAAQTTTAEATQSELAQTTAPVTEETTAPTAAPEPDAAVDADRPEAFGERCGNDQLPVLEQLMVVADGGLNARQLPGDGDVITTLPDGTIVDTFGEGIDCGVLDDGSVWFMIGTPLLATGGWVHSGFLAPVDETGNSGNDANASADDDRVPSFGERCGNDQLPVLEQLMVVADGGLNARQFPGDGDVIATLPEGTIVDTIGEADACGVLDDGSVWFEIGTPLLATGGWVHSGFLAPTDS